MNNDRRDDICFIRFCAIILIANSHLDSLYPVPQLGTGGSLGNSLFFMMSGYCLVLSEKRRARPFLEWYWRRITRIYPTLIIAVGLTNLLIAGGWRNWIWKNYLTAFVWPIESAWFVAALMVFYVVFFVFMKLRTSRAYIVGILLLLIPYCYWYFSYMDLSRYTIEGPGYFKWIFYFQVMLFGGYLALKDAIVKRGNLTHFIGLSGAILLYYLTLVMVSRGHGTIQALVHLLTFPIVYLMLVIARSPLVNGRLMATKSLRFLATLIAGITLEIYLLHGLVYSNRLVQTLVFPLNIAVFWVVVVVLSLALAKVAGFIRIIFRTDGYAKA